MSVISTFVDSSIGRKYLSAITGLLWVGFLGAHLLGNLLLLAPDGGDAFNLYAHGLDQLGPALYVAEFGLVATLLLHAYMGMKVRFGAKAARPVGYAVSGDAGGASQKSLASLGMAVTGLLLLAFVALHLWQFKYGPEYSIVIDGVEMRDLYKVVVDVYQNPVWVAVYVATMLALAAHLRHGFWSAFQSLGLSHPRFMPAVQVSGKVIAALCALGFIILPIFLLVKGAA